MFRFAINVSLIICLAVADVIAQYGKATIGKIAGAAPARRLAISAGSLSSKPPNWSSMLPKFLVGGTSFLSSTAFLAQSQFSPEIVLPQNFDAENCIFTMNFSQLLNPVIESMKVISYQIEDGVGKEGPFLQIDVFEGASLRPFESVLHGRCLIDLEKAIIEFNKLTKVLTVNFVHAPDSDPEETAPISSDDKAPKQSPDDKKPDISQDFDAATCRLTIDLSQLPKPAIKSVEVIDQPRPGQAVHTQVTTGTSIQDIYLELNCTCVADLKKAIVFLSNRTKILTIVFPHAPASPECPRSGESVPLSPTGQEIAPTASNDDKEQTPSKVDNKLQKGDKVGDFIKGNLMPRPVSVITK